MRFCQQAPWACSWKCHSLKLCFPLNNFILKHPLSYFLSFPARSHFTEMLHRVNDWDSPAAAGDKTKNTCMSRDLTFLSLCLSGFSPNMLLLEFLHEFTSQLLYKDEHVHTHMFLISVCRCLPASSPATQCFLSPCLYLSLHTLFLQPAEVS